MDNKVTRVLAQHEEQFLTLKKGGTFEIAEGVRKVYIDGAGEDFILNLFDPIGHSLIKPRFLVVCKNANSVVLNAPQGLVGASGIRNTSINGVASKTMATVVNGVLELTAVDEESFIITQEI